VDLAYYLIGDRQVMALTTSDHYKFGNTIPAVRMIERVDGRVGSVGDYPEERRIHAVAVRGDCLERYHYRVGISGSYVYARNGTQLRSSLSRLPSASSRDR
jgi:hypothetical protein